jgi:hypothetical protein
MHAVRSDEDKEDSKKESETKELETKTKPSQDEGNRMQPHEHTKIVRLRENVHDKLVTIARGMIEQGNTLITCLQNNQDVFS